MGKSNNKMFKCTDWKFEWELGNGREGSFNARIPPQISTRFVTKCFV